MVCRNYSEKYFQFEFEYSEGNIPLELFLRGLVSLCLTMVNIICILLFGVLTLYIKQVRERGETAAWLMMVFCRSHRSVFPRGMPPSGGKTSSLTRSMRSLYRVTILMR